MRAILQMLLLLIGILAFLAGFAIMVDAQGPRGNALHEIEALICFVIATCAVGGLAVAGAVEAQTAALRTRQPPSDPA